MANFLSGAFRGRRMWKEGAWSLTKLQRACSCVCTTLCMLELEGKQRFPLKAVTGLSESHFHRLHGYQQIFFSVKVLAALPFILLIAARGRKETSLCEISLSSFEMMPPNLQWIFHGSLPYHWADSGTGEQTVVLGTLFLSHPRAEPASDRELKGASKTEKLQESSLSSLQDTSNWALPHKSNHLMATRGPQDIRG